MLFLSAQNITKSFGLTNLFANISLNIFDNERIGLIGPNGAGKSTLLKIFMDLEHTDEGKITQANNVHLIYLAQADSFDNKQTIKQILFPRDTQLLADEQCLNEIRELTADTFALNLQQSIEELSGGWRKRIAILQALLQKPDLLLMDEPTNHLDLAGILWLENILKKTNIAFMIISHDRAFLENTVNSIIELNKIYPDGYLKINGNYSQFLQKRIEFLQQQSQYRQTLANQLRREQDWLNRMPKARTTKAQFRIDQAQQMKEDLAAANFRNTQSRKATIHFAATERKTKKLLSIHDVSMARNNKQLFSHLEFTLSPGMCLGLLGKNGSGKSTLIHLLNSDLSPDAGKIERAEQLRVVLFDQKRAQLNQEQTLKEALAPDGDSVFYQGQNIHVAAWAQRFLFTKDQLPQRIASLSGGEQARVLIANLMRQSADVLLLDEPTNDLDIPTLEVLEESLLEFPGAIVLITHDRFLLDRLSDSLLYLDGKGRHEFFADYVQFLNYQTRVHTEIVKATGNKTEPENKTLDYEQQKELNRLPDKIQKLETELKLLEEQMYLPEILNNYQKLQQQNQKITACKEKIEQLYTRWQELEN